MGNIDYKDEKLNTCRLDNKVDKCEKGMGKISNIQGYNYNISSDHQGFDLDSVGNRQMANPFLISVLPKNFQQKFQHLFSEKFPQYKDGNDGTVFFKGSIYSENILYNYINAIESVDKLPSVMLTYDINGLYHKRFISRFLNNRNFDVVRCGRTNKISNLEHYSHLLRVVACDALVMVVRKSKFMCSSYPEDWYELLDPKFSNQLVIPGDIDFFCNTFFLHYVREFGYGAVHHLLKNIKGRLHPETMTKVINQGDEIDASVIVMPYSYALSLNNKLDYEIVMPKAGPMLIPIQLLVKKGCYKKYSNIIHFITGMELGSEFEKSGFLFTHYKSPGITNDDEINWLGWDYMNSVDIESIKKNISAILRTKS